MRIAWCVFRCIAHQRTPPPRLRVPASPFPRIPVSPCPRVTPSRRAHRHTDAVDVVVGDLDELLDQPAPPEVRADRRHLVELDAARHQPALAGEQVILRLAVDDALFEVFLAADGPAEGKIDARGIEVDAETPDAGLLIPGVLAFAARRGCCSSR